MPEEQRLSNREFMVQRSRLLMMVLLRELDLLVRTLKQMQAGFPSGLEGGAGDWDDRTQAAAMVADRARKDFRRLDGLVKDIDAKCNELDSIRTYWTVTAKNMTTGTQEKGCRSCARIKVDIGGRKVDKWSPRRKLSEKTVEEQDENGNTVKKTIENLSNYCEWCDDWLASEGEVPPFKVLEARHEGRRITNSLLAKLGVETKSASARDRRRAS